MNRRTLIILIHIFLVKGLCAQVPDSTFNKDALKNAIYFYHLSEGEQSALYNGNDYAMDASRIAEGGHLFFKSDSMIEGTIDYNGVRYQNISFLYDLAKDEIVVNGRVGLISLVKDKINSFSVAGHIFIRTGNDNRDSVLQKGFYEQIYSGNITVLVKHIKRIEEAMSNRDIAGKVYYKRIVQYSKKYYIGKNGRSYSFKNMAELLNVLKDEKRSIRQYIKENNINYKDNPEDAILKIAKYYNHQTERN